ncbi:MAG: PspC domain-containing protein [Chloroflexota bacterium]|nr:PspC domain-containing protein [Chloroflexota bacterium]
MNRRLYRSVHERVLGGVAGGVAEYFDLDPSLVRVAWAILILASAGSLLVLYIVMWIVVPEAPETYAANQTSAAPPIPPAPTAPSGDHASTVPPAGSATSGAPPAGASAGGPTPSGPGTSSAYGWTDHRYQTHRHRRSGGGGVVIGAALVLAGTWILVKDTFTWIRLPDLWPILIIAVGLLLLYGAVRPRND